MNYCALSLFKNLTFFNIHYFFSPNKKDLSFRHLEKQVPHDHFHGRYKDMISINLFENLLLMYLKKFN